MLKSLYWKLALAFMLIAFITAGLVAIFIRVTSADRLLKLVIDQQRANLEQTLTDYYTAHGSWEGIMENWGELQRVSAPTPVHQEPPIQEPVGENTSQGAVAPNISAPPQTANIHNPPQSELRPERRGLFGLADAQGKIIIPLEPDYPTGAVLPQSILEKSTPITVNDQQVGFILTARRMPGFNPAEALFIRRTNEALLMAMLGALLVALMIGIFLARTLTRPLQALTRAAQNIAEGHLEQQVKVNSHDEIGQLARAFNRMSQEVARVNYLRRQMTADIAHDLRTPLTVIAGYIESMRDGVLQPTPQRLSLIYGEIERLLNLVGDLRMLSQADAGELPLNPQPISPKALLERVVEVFRHHAEQRQITLAVNGSDDLPEIQLDETRMMQVMDNLISNALRYTPAGGSITLSARLSENKVVITVQDTGEGIEPEELPHIFDRFHRADKSRHSESGETGLGLAIVKALVEAHKGRVWADSAPGKGTIVSMEFPIGTSTPS